MRGPTVFLVLTIFLACHGKDEPFTGTPPALMVEPRGFPALEVPSDNAFTQKRWALGKRLFYDPVLSRDSSLSCASCHNPSFAFSDEVPLSLGVEQRLGTRNVPTLANVAYHPYFTREGGVPTLEMQVFVPVQEHNEFDFNMVLLAERLKQDSTYLEMANQAYGREVDAFVITRALACFERSLLSGYSLYDQYTQYDRKDALSVSAQRGMDLFFSTKTNCSRCHGGFDFTDYSFANNGLYADYDDEGRYRLTRLESDRALFKVPSLRNVARTAPYMHDGSLATLTEVLEHYQGGGEAHPQKSDLIRPLNLSEQEQLDLLAFLHALTDESFLNNDLFRN